MSTELDTLFSDFDFFDQLFDNITEKPTLNTILEKLSKNKSIDIKKFEQEKFSVRIDPEARNDKPDVYFHMNVTLKDLNNYNPKFLTLRYNEDVEKYQVFSINYTANNKSLTLSHIHDGPHKIIPHAKELYFYNSEEATMLKFVFNNMDFSLKLKCHRNIKNATYEKFNNYLSNLNIIEIEEAISLVEVLTGIKKRSSEKIDLDKLKDDYCLEDCLFASNLKKAESQFKKNHDIIIKRTIGKS